jgi:uncharacterized membrane protein YbhN (UPF0104 family)
LKKKTKKLLKLFIQIALTIFALWFLFTKIDINEVSSIIKQSNLFYLFLAFIAFNVSKIVSAIRLNRFFLDIDLKLSQMYNLVLYYLGMFYNLFLPGGIGGDGYKVYLLNKQYNIKALELIKVLLMDRISGLIALIFFTTLLTIFSTFAKYDYIMILSIIGAITIYPISLLLYKYKFKRFLGSFYTVNNQALIVQFAQLLCAYFIIIAFNTEVNIVDYLAIFLISSVVAVLPFTVGGVGARELTFLYLLQLINSDATVGVALSLMFFIITAISSFIGIIPALKPSVMEKYK